MGFMLEIVASNPNERPGLVWIKGVEDDTVALCEIPPFCEKETLFGKAFRGPNPEDTVYVLPYANIELFSLKITTSDNYFSPFKQRYIM